MNATLKQAVIKQLGYESEDDVELISTCEDISNHGIDGGFGKFIYYTDTVAFAEEHKSEILRECREQADEFGMDGAYSFIASFNCLSDYTADQVADTIHAPEDENGDYTEIMNALAWFAAEEVAREIADD